MRLESALFSSREGLTASGQAISVVGDNIANSSTVGYKSSRVEFADVLGAGTPDGMSGGGGGNGVAVSHVRQMHATGIIENTGRSMDVGIAGNGFFMVGDAESPLYSRAGNFTMNEDGLLANGDGKTVLGFQGSDTKLGTIDLTNIGTTGKPTATLNVYGNLNAGHEAVTAVPTAPESFLALGRAATFIGNQSVFDSLGSEHQLTIAYFKTGTNTWTAQAYMDGGDVGKTAGVPEKVASTDATLQFNTAGGIDVANAGSAALTVAASYGNGAAAGSFKVDLSKFSQYSGTDQVTSVSQDGNSAGNIKDYHFERDGTIYANLDTGSSALVGRLQLADFRNLDGLNRAGNGYFVQGDSTGSPVTGSPGDKAFGTIEAGSLERSNVDLASQFIDLILYQRHYQGCSQTLSATSQTLRDTLNLIR